MRLHWGTLLKWAHLYSKIKTQKFRNMWRWTAIFWSYGSSSFHVYPFCHITVHRATCIRSVTLQFIVSRVPSLSHHSSLCHVYPVCHITVHRATYIRSVTLQFIVPRVRNLSHYSSSCHVYPVCHMTVHCVTCTQSVTLHSFFMLTLSLTLILGSSGLLLSLHCTCFSFRLPNSTSFIRAPQSGRFLGLLFSASNFSDLFSDNGCLPVTQNIPPLRNYRTYKPIEAPFLSHL